LHPGEIYVCVRSGGGTSAWNKRGQSFMTTTAPLLWGGELRGETNEKRL
jgi:hypothetical protein